MSWENILDMALQTGDILEVTTRQRYTNRPLYNVWQFRVESAGIGATETDVSDAWIEQRGTLLNAIQTVSVNNVDVIVRNITNPLYEGGSIWTGIGAVGQAGFPSYVTLPIQLLRATTLTRNGAKRIGGLPEGFYDDAGLITNVGYRNAVITFCDTIVDDFFFLDSDENPVVLKPVLVGRNANGSYNLGRVNTLIGYSFSNTSTQRSRRIVST